MSPWLVNTDGGPIAVGNSGPGALIYFQGASEPETKRFIQDFLKPGMTFVDVGAHFGEYVLLATEIKDVEIHAFEPHPSIFDLLQKNVSLNKPSRVVLNNCAVFNSNCSLELFSDGDPATSSVRFPSHSEGFRSISSSSSFPIRAIHLDRYCAQLGVSPDLIKIDVEGAELPVMQGAKQTLSQPSYKAPVLVFEVSGKNFSRFGYTPKHLFDFLKKFDYEIHGYTQDGQLHRVHLGSLFQETVNLVASKTPLSENCPAGALPHR
jgi:FkbM family methyltransferase